MAQFRTYAEYIILPSGSQFNQGGLVGAGPTFAAWWGVAIIGERRPTYVVLVRMRPGATRKRCCNYAIGTGAGIRLQHANPDPLQNVHVSYCECSNPSEAQDNFNDVIDCQPITDCRTHFRICNKYHAYFRTWPTWNCLLRACQCIYSTKKTSFYYFSKTITLPSSDSSSPLPQPSFSSSSTLLHTSLTSGR